MVRVALLTNIPSPHQLPLARALVALLGPSAYRYVYTEPTHDERAKMGWQAAAEEPWCRQGTMDDAELLEAEVLLSGHRALDLFRQRNAAGKVTLYASERWFKPPLGMLRLLVPTYFRMAWRFAQCVKAPNFTCLPMGIYAARDMLRLLGLLRGDLCCLFRAPKVAFESRPGGAIVPLDDVLRSGCLDAEAVRFAKRYGFVQIPESHWGAFTPRGLYAKVRLWGYFVAPSAHSQRGVGGHTLPIEEAPRALWVGRLLDWKRVEVLARACRPRPDLKRAEVSLDIYGHGPEEERLRRENAAYPNIAFHDFVPVERVRDLMRSHDIYVLPSNAYEGWGAVVSEALEEGMRVLASVQTGAGATMLPPSHLYDVDDEARLAELLRTNPAPLTIGPWTADNAAHVLQTFLAQR